MGFNLHEASTIAANQHWHLQIGWHYGLTRNAIHMILVQSCVANLHRIHVNCSVVGEHRIDRLLSWMNLQHSWIPMAISRLERNISRIQQIMNRFQSSVSTATLSITPNQTHRRMNPMWSSAVTTMESIFQLVERIGGDLVHLLDFLQEEGRNA